MWSFKDIKEKIVEKEKYFSMLALAGGFTIDNLTLRRIDLLVENVLIAAYLCLALVAILLLNFSHAGYFRHKLFSKIDPFLSLALQFLFGALFSVFFVFYFRSASLLASWVFVLFLAFLLLGNEFFRERYRELSFQLTIFFTALFSYAVFLLPLVTKKIGSGVFVLSSLCAALLISAIILFIKKMFPKRFDLNKKSILINLSSVFVLFNVFYFANIIPPIPLALTEAEIAHKLERVGGSYEVYFEKSPFYSLKKSSSIYTWQEGEPLYFFTSVFAPTDIRTNIYHEWYFRQEGDWVLKSKLSYPILGGRDGGYRGFSYKYSLAPGDWKIRAVNERGQVLGERRFEIVRADEAPALEKAYW